MLVIASPCDVIRPSAFVTRVVNAVRAVLLALLGRPFVVWLTVADSAVIALAFAVSAVTRALCSAVTAAAASALFVLTTASSACRADTSAASAVMRAWRSS
ncbi:hypothetical protein D3C87_1066470 [compost metagenome]